MASANTPAPVLLIEDQPILVDLLTAALSARGYDVIAARTAAGALDLARELRPSAVLLDARMRLDEGWAFTCAYRHMGTHAPVVAFSASDAGGEGVRRAALLRADEVVAAALPEPAALDELVALVAQRVVGHNRRQGTAARRAHPALLERLAAPVRWVANVIGHAAGWRHDPPYASELAPL